MANPFDQFDAQASASANPFDQFDAAAGNTRQPAKIWSDAPATMLQNAPGSAADYLSGVYNAVAHPLNTLTDVADVAAGGVRAGVKAVLPTNVFNAIDDLSTPAPSFINFTKENAERKANAMGQALGNRYGGGKEIFNTVTTDPVGVLGDASAVLMGPEMLAGRAPGVVGTIARTAGEVGSAIDPLNLAAKGIGAGATLAGKTAAGGLGITTGVGAGPINAAYDAGRTGRSAFIDAMQGKSSAADAVGEAADAMSAKYQQRGQDYTNNKNDWSQSTVQLNRQPLGDALVDAQEKFKSDSGFIKNQAAAKTFDDMVGTIADWARKNPNPLPTDYDDLKQAMGSIRDSENVGTLSHTIANDVYKSIDTQLKTEVPGYQEAMSSYAGQSNDLRQLAQTMSLKGPNTNVDIAARKLLSGLRDGVNTNFGQRKALLDQLNAQNPNLIPTLAGLSMSSATPVGLAKHVASSEALLGALHNPALLLGLPLTSPKLVGYGAYGAGRAAAGLNALPTQGLLNAANVSSRLNGLLNQ